MLKAWDRQAAAAVKAGLIKEVKVVNANNSASEQASQIQSLIVEGWDAIVIDAGSTTALNGVIQEACDAHITVIVFDGLATAPAPTRSPTTMSTWAGKRSISSSRRWAKRATFWKSAALRAVRLTTTSTAGLPKDWRSIPG